jgi:ATP-dependent RNA helicase DDX41
LGHAPPPASEPSSNNGNVRFDNDGEAKEEKDEHNAIHNENNNEDENHHDEGDTATHVQSMLERVEALQDNRTDAERTTAKRKEEEDRILRESSKVQTNALQAASELAHGVSYKEPMPSSWTVPRYILEQRKEAWEKVRKEWHMEVEGEQVPPPMKRIADMKLPPPILQTLTKKGIKRPTPIQMQGLPVALASRDMVCHSIL